jgi:chromosome segregation ATPase
VPPRLAGLATRRRRRRPAHLSTRARVDQGRHGGSRRRRGGPPVAILGALEETSSPEQAGQDSISLSLERAAFGGFSRESVQAAIERLTTLLTDAQRSAADAAARAADAEARAERLRAEGDRLVQELEKYRSIEHSLAQTLARAEATAGARVKEAEDEAQRVLGEARSTASDAARNAVADRDRAVAEAVRIRDQLARALAALDAALAGGFEQR